MREREALSHVLSQLEDAEKPGTLAGGGRPT
jgi:hypothetical protein